jgi:hypothetical protein
MVWKKTKMKREEWSSRGDREDKRKKKEDNYERKRLQAPVLFARFCEGTGEEKGPETNKIARLNERRELRKIREDKPVFFCGI